MPESYTPRGFAMYTAFDHADYHGEESGIFTVQESSLATERKVWVGQNEHRAHLSEDEARKVRDALTEFLDDWEYAWSVDPLGTKYPSKEAAEEFYGNPRQFRRRPAGAWEPVDG